MRRALLLAFLLILLVGCFQRAPRQDANEEARQAMEQFWTDLGDPGTITDLKGEILNADTAVQTILLEFGSNGILHVTIKNPQGDDSEIYCDQTHTTLVTDSETAMFRSGCWGPGGFLVAHSSYAARFAVRETRVESSTREGDVITATYVPQGNSSEVRYEARIEDGRIQTLKLSGNQTTRAPQAALIQFTVTYGERQPIPRPPPDKRIPAGLTVNTTFAPGEYRWNLLANASGALDPAEFEVRIVAASQAPTADPVANFSLRDGIEQVSQGFTFRFQDDGDGALDVGDSFVVSNPDWTTQEQYQVIVWDAWANAPVSATAMPGLAFLIVAIAFVAAAFLRR